MPEKSSRLNKTQAILKYLQEGNTITNLQAYAIFKETRLGDVIFRLRRMGHNIETTIVKTEEGDRYGIYSLDDKPDPLS